MKGFLQNMISFSGGSSKRMISDFPEMSDDDVENIHSLDKKLAPDKRKIRFREVKKKSFPRIVTRKRSKTNRGVTRTRLTGINLKKKKRSRSSSFTKQIQTTFHRIREIGITKRNGKRRSSFSLPPKPIPAGPNPKLSKSLTGIDDVVGNLNRVSTGSLSTESDEDYGIYETVFERTNEKIFDNKELPQITKRVSERKKEERRKCNNESGEFDVLVKRFIDEGSVDEDQLLDDFEKTMIQNSHETGDTKAVDDETIKKLRRNSTKDVVNI